MTNRAKSNKIKNVLYIVATVVAMNLVAVIIFIYFHINEKIETPQTLFIPRGSISQIISHINDELGEVVLIPDVDKYLLSYFGNPQAGWLKFDEVQMTRGEFLEALTKAKGVSKGITLYPGETTEYFIYTIANKYNSDYDELLNYYYSASPIKEGFLIPDTYQINSNIDLKKFIADIIKKSEDKHKERLEKLGIKNKIDDDEFKKILTVASIIQKESASMNEMPVIASVIYNRLDSKMRLQMDGTLNYGLFSHQKISPQRIKTDNTRYNTYKFSGLPSDPVCNPSFEAIKSAINPIDTDFLFFFKRKGENVHIFSRNYSEHLAVIEGNISIGTDNNGILFAQPRQKIINSQIGIEDISLNEEINSEKVLLNIFADEVCSEQIFFQK